MKKILAVCFLLFVVVTIYAVAPTPSPIVKTQPDGTTVTLFLRGDKYNHHYETADGQVMERNDKGYYVAVKESRKSPSMEPRRSKEQIAATFPLTGKVRSLAILVNFTDVKFVTPNANQAFHDLLNKTGYSENGATGCANDYFLASSNGQFDPTFDVYGPYTLSNSMEYYGNNKGNGHSAHADEMIMEACALAVNEGGVDFTQYDLNGDGVIDNVFVYYAGYNEAEGGPENSVWPHRGAVPTRPKYSGKELYDYACTSELKYNSGATMCGIGTFCHEFGHVLGLPDYYNTTDNEGHGTTYTVGSWDIMCNGNYNNEGRTPPVYSAFSRFMLGWLKPEQLLTANNFILEPIETSNKAYLIAARQHNLVSTSPNPTEYFLIENRQRVGWDAFYDDTHHDSYGDPYQAIYGVGLLISHITFNASAYSNNTFNNSKPLGFDIVEPFTTGQPSKSSDADTYPGRTNKRNFIPKLNDGTVLQEMLLSKIQQNADNTVSFHFGVDEGVGFSFQPDALETFVTTINSGKIVDAAVQDLKITGSGLPTDSILFCLNNSSFEMCVDGNWMGSVRVFRDAVKADSTYERTVQLRHKPSRMNCKTTSGVFEVMTIDSLIFNQLQLVGTAPRPVLISAVKNLPATDVTPYSFTANWEEQKDATTYYLQVYMLKDEPSEHVQSFESFDTQAGIASEGWQANFLGLTTSELIDGKCAILMSSTGNMLTTENYLVPVSKISFWLSNTYLKKNDQDASGKIVLEAMNSSEEWKEIDNFNVLRTTKGVTKEYSFAQTDGYLQFRLTYTHNGGDGGAVIDKFVANTDKVAEYVYKDTQMSLPAPASSMEMTSLSPNTTYYYQLQCSEDKGCEEHFSLLATPTQVKTFPGSDSDKQFTVISSEDGSLVAFLPSNSSSKNRICLFTATGDKIDEVVVYEGDTKVVLPTRNLIKGQTYMAKYMSADKMKRKDLWSKFIY